MTRRSKRSSPGILTFLRASVLGALLMTPVAFAQASPAPLAAKLGRGIAAAPKMVDVGALPEITAAEVAMQPKKIPLRVGHTTAEWATIKGQAAAIRFVPQGGKASPPPVKGPGGSGRSPGTVGAITAYAGAGEIACGNVTPADQAVAVGEIPSGILHVINVCYEVFNATGSRLSGYPKSMTALGGLPAGTAVTDPRAIYDAVHHRYIVTFIQFDPNFASPSHYVIAVSNADNPGGTFCTYELGVQSVGVSNNVYPLPDFPRLGQDRDAIYVASNIFNPNYNSEEILMLPKSALYACKGFGFNYFSGLTLGGTFTDTTQPANFYNPADVPASEILVTSKNINFGCSSSCNGLVVWAIHSPLSSPTLSGIAIATGNNYAYPPAASQNGGANDVDTGDARISGMVMAVSGSVYASINTNGGGGQPAFIMYQIQPFLDGTGKITSARLLNEIFHGGGANAFYYATQQPDYQGNVTNVFNFSSSSTFPSLAYSSRRVSQAVGTEPDTGIFLVSGQAFYNQGRWGDYTATSPGGVDNPAVTPTMYFGGMYSDSNGNWATELGRNGYTTINQSSTH